MKKQVSPSRVQSTPPKRLFWQGFLCVLVLILTFVSGWSLRGITGAPKAQATDSACLRLNGYTFISPLLLCDTSSKTNSPAVANLQTKLQAIVGNAQAAHTIDTASIYFRDLTTRNQTNINGDEKYYPASLRKVPVLMSFYKKAEADPAILTTTGMLHGTTDYNAGVEIPPKVSPQFGQTYSINDLITMMIKYSDNNSLQVLAANLGDNGLREIYQQLQIEYPENQLAVTDSLSAYQFSLFLRTLYNSTYLDSEYSEKALQLMSQTDFKDGLVAGLPSTITVAHKFGVETDNANSGALNQRQLHDCGIIYAPKTPYILCVMTKSSGSLAEAEKTIKDISAVTYQEVQNGYR